MTPKEFREKAGLIGNHDYDKIDLLCTEWFLSSAKEAGTTEVLKVVERLLEDIRVLIAG